MRPTIRQLEYFVALSRRLNFRTAAEDCNISQPALSTQIQQLEEVLGVQLVERNRRVVRLTDKGAQAAQAAKQLLNQVDELVDSLQRSGPLLAGSLRLGVIPTIAPYILPSIFPILSNSYPELKLTLREDLTARLVEALNARELDALLLALPVNSRGVETLDLAEDPFVLAVPSSHALAQKSVIDVEDLQGAHVLLQDDGHCFRDHALELCKKGLAKEQNTLRGAGFDTLVQMVAQGLGVTLLPRLALQVEASRSGKTKFIPFRDPAPVRTLGMMWREESSRANEYKLLGSIIKDALHSHLASPMPPAYKIVQAQAS